MTLNIAQKTSLGITLREFEVRLTRLRVLLEQYESVTRLTPEGVARLREMLDREQAIIDDLFRRFQLKRETIDVVQSMMAELSISWTQLVDSRSDKLGRYGEVDPGLKSSLDPAIDQLSEACLDMVRLLEKARVDPTERGGLFHDPILSEVLE